MIQRKQTIFLLLALAALIACLCLPIGAFEPKTMGAPQEWFNLGQQTENGLQLSVIPFANLAVVIVLTLIDIFLFKNRKLQIRICTLAIVLSVLWYLYVGGYIYGATQAGAHFLFRFGACLPLIAIILLFMARAGIKADERLVRSMDRIR